MRVVVAIAIAGGNFLSACDGFELKKKNDCRSTNARFFAVVLGYGRPASDEDDDNIQSDTPQGNPTIVTRSQEFIAQLKGDLMLPCQVEHNEQDDSIAWMHFNNNLFTDVIN
ncbi:hypothetical protein U1Q18_052301 [Sarracenia purpurea var. burkii]